MAAPNGEQTASLLSLALYFFLDPIIFLAYRIPHLKFEQIPALSDADDAQNLRARAFPVRLTIAPVDRNLTSSSIWTF